MPLPAQIAVKYTEEEAEYLSVRPVVRQTFQLAELIDMILGVAGKDLPRIQQILHSGTIVFNFYRYWWQGFDADANELAALLAKFPDANPTHSFRAEECAIVLLAGKSYQPPQHVSAGFSLPTNAVELRREDVARKKLFSGKSFWDVLMSLAKEPPRHSDSSRGQPRERSDESLIGSVKPCPAYLGYSYLRHADVYDSGITPEQAASLARDAEKLAPRAVRALLTQISAAAHVLFLCPRTSSTL
jgi:hypothetical protein